LPWRCSFWLGLNNGGGRPIARSLQESSKASPGTTGQRAGAGAREQLKRPAGDGEAQQNQIRSNSKRPNHGSQTPAGQTLQQLDQIKNDQQLQRLQTDQQLRSIEQEKDPLRQQQQLNELQRQQQIRSLQEQIQRNQIQQDLDRLRQQQNLR
jgi:hypothetical protein